MAKDASAILDAIDDNRSVWVAGKPAFEPLAALGEDTTCDVAVVGGGFTGVSTALHLSERAPERSVVLLEARRIGTGASGRNGGLVLNWVNGVESRDAEHAKLVYEGTSAGIDTIERIVREHVPDVPFRRGGTTDVFTNAARAEEAARDVERLRSVGLPLEFLDRDAMKKRLSMEGTFGAIHDPTTGRLDGVAYLRALRGVLVARGVRVHEDTPVLRVEEGQTITLTTPRATVRAKAVVLGVDVWAAGLGYFGSTVVPLHSHVIATEPLSRERWAEIGWGDTCGFSDDLDRIAYASMTAKGELVFGGGSNASYGYLFGSKTRWDGPAEAGFAAVHQRMLKYLPAAREVKIAHRWTGAVGATMSRICTMGVTGAHRNVYFAVGFSGHGVTLANLAGRVLTDIYLGADERWRAQPFYDQELHWIPPEPLRWIGYHVVTALTGKSPRKHG